MKKKLLLGVFFSFLVFLFSTCTFLYIRLAEENVPLGDVIPWGVWQSDNPAMILYIDLVYQFRVQHYFSFPGFYTLNGVDRKIFVGVYTMGDFSYRIGRYRPHFMYIRDLTAPWPGSERQISREDGFQIINNNLHFITRDREIIFHPVETYKSISLDDWRACEYLPGVWKSAYPIIILYFDNMYSLSASSPNSFVTYPGVAYIDGQELQLRVRMDHRGRTFSILMPNSTSLPDYSGILRIEGEQLYFILDPITKRNTGLSTIIFDRQMDSEDILQRLWAYEVSAFYD